MRILHWLMIYVPSAVLMVTVLEVAKSLGSPFPLTATVGLAAGLGAHEVLHRLVTAVFYRT